MRAQRTYDPWLYPNGKRERVKLAKAAGAAVGGLEPASDHTFRMITAPGIAKITNWGGLTDPTGRVVVMKRGADAEPPASRQLQDPFALMYIQGAALEPPLPLDRMLNLTEENPLHSACLMAKATDACGRGWSFEPKDEQAEGDEDDDVEASDVPDKLSERMEDITPDLTFSEMLYQAAWEMGTIGWGIWEAIREDAKPGQYGEIAALYPIPGHMIRATLDPRKYVQIRAGRVRFFKKFGAKCTIDNETGDVFSWDDKRASKAAAAVPSNRIASELILFKEYTSRSLWYGMPKWCSCIPTIAEMTAIREFNVSWFSSGGQTDYHIHAKAQEMATATDIKDQIKTQLEENKGRGHTLLITAGTADTEVKAEKLGELLREGHFRFRRGDLAKEILIAHCVPPYRIGWAETGSLGGNAAPEMLDAYNSGAIEPIQTIIQDRLRQTLFNADLGGIKTGDFRFKLKKLEYNTDESQRIIDEVKYGIITPNQAREALGHERDEEVEELDEYWYNGQPLGAEPEPPFGGDPNDPNANPFDPAAEEETTEQATEEEQGQDALANKKRMSAIRQRAVLPRKSLHKMRVRRRKRTSLRASLEQFEKTLKDALAG